MKLDLYGWMPDENKEVLARLIKEHDIKTVIEIGCFLGLSTKFFVEQGCEVIVIDTFEGSEDINKSEDVRRRLPTLYEQFMFNMQELGIEDKVTVMKMSSEDAFDYCNNFITPSSKAELVYIDGSHVYEDVKKDIDMWIGIAKKIICGDDYTEHQPGVRRAVDELPYAVNKGQRVWYIVK